MARAVETVQPLIDERGHQSHAGRRQTSRLRVFGDPLRLTQALGNVLANAAKYTERGGQIRLTARQVDGIGRDPGARQRHRHPRRAAADDF